MTKFRKSLILIGCIILCVAGALAAFFVMSASGFITSDPIEIELEVSYSEKIYDGTPLHASEYKLVSGELLSGHEFKVTYTGSQTDVGVSASGMDVKVLDNFGRDVTNNYALTIDEGILVVNKRTVIAMQEDVSYEYSGQPNFGGNYFDAFGSLCNGHSLVRVNSIDAENITSDYAVNAGIYKDELGEPKVLDASGMDVTSNYDVRFSQGYIIVEKRKVMLELVSVEKVYDGVTIAPSYKIAAGSLVAYDNLDVSFTIDGKSEPNFSMTKPDSVTVGTESVRVYSISGDNITDNYAVTFSKASAKLTITPRALRVVGAGGSWSYDGNIHDTKNLVDETMVTGLCSLDTFNITYNADIRDVGVKANTFTVSITRDEENVEDCYDIDYVEKNLEITPLAVTVTCNSPEDKTYDGEALEFNIDSLLDGFESITFTGELDKAEELKAECRKNLILNKQENIVNAGTYNYTVTLKANSNFVLSASAGGSVTINPKPINVTKKEVEPLTYSGEDFYFTYVDVVETDAAAEEATYLLLTIEGNKTIKNAETYKYNLHIDETRKNSQNYVVAGDTSGTIIVNPKPLTVTVTDISRTYTGEEIRLSVNDVITETDATEAEKVYLKVTTKTKAINVDTYKFNVEVNGTKNYELIKQPEGDLIVTPKTINVTTKDVTRVYSGEAFDFNIDDVAFTTATVAEKEILKVSYDKVLNAGDYRFTISLSDKQNYELNGATDGTITVNPKPINIEPKDIDRNYNKDGQTFEAQDLISNSEDVGKALTFIEPVPNKPVTNVDTYTVTFRLKGEGSDNYVLNGNAVSKITVNPYSFSLTAKEDVEEYTYSGSIYTYSVADLVNLNGVPEDAQPYLKLSTDKIMQNAGNYKFTVKLEGTNNYILEENLTGVFNINPKQIDFNQKAIVRTYTGSSFTFTLEDAVDGTLTSEQRDNLTLTANDGYEIINVYDNYTYEVNLKDDVENYILGTVTGEAIIGITPKPINVSLKDVEQVYSEIALDISEEDIDKYVITNATEDEKWLLQLKSEDEVILNVNSYTYSVEITDPNYILIGSFTGTIKIIPKKIEIQTNPQSESQNYTGQEIPFDLEDLITVVDGDYSNVAEYLQAVYNGTVCNAGTYNYEIVLQNTKNYVLSGNTKGTVTIDPIEVTLGYSGELKKVYDGTPFSFEASKFTLTTGLSKSFYVSTFIADTGDSNAGKNKKFTVKSIVIRDSNSEDVTGNFKFEETTFNTGEITTRTIYIKANDANASGEEFLPRRNDESYLKGFGVEILGALQTDIVSGWTFLLPPSGSGTTYTLVVDKSAVHIERDGIDVTDNYNIKTIDGTITLIFS